VAGQTAVEARQVVKVFGSGDHALRALDDVSLTIETGEFFTLLGPSGCGKTTLLRCIAGFETPTAGAILLSGRDFTAEPPNRRPVNTVFQSYALFPHLTVAQNIGFGLEMLGRPRAEVAATVERMLALVKLEAFAGRRPQQLSGGQQQRVALARALAPAPQVLLLDEPLSALDLKLRKEMQGELKRLQHETGITFVFVTHDQEEALTMSDRIGVMSEGRLLQIGAPREIYNHPVNRFVADFIGETNFLRGRVAQDGLYLATGERVGAAPPSGARIGEATLAVRPEQVRLEGPGDPGSLSARVTQTVYFGTDTHCHLHLADGTEIIARLQSPPSGDVGLAPGAEVGVRFAEGALQVLGD
jgi:spermidine/putrescine transport system ATP-binding protein